MATINHKKYDEATETFKDFNVYDGKETLIFKVDGEGQKTEFEKPVSFAGGLEDFVSNDQPAIYRAFSTTGSYPFNRYGDLVIQARSSHDRNIVFAAGTSPAVIASMTSDGLCFGSDTAAANALDDYEEGTWTPILRGAATAGTYETLDPVAKYTKIGNQVNLNMRMVLAASVTGGGTGYAIISNLPFTKSSDQQAVGSVVFSNVTFSAGTIQVLTEFQTSAASSNIYFPQVISGSGITDLPISAFTGSEVIRLSITYFV